jgi:hypothetical protein
MSTSTPTIDSSSEQKQPAIYATAGVDLIYHNMHAGSDFRTSRGLSSRSIEYELLKVAKHLKDECYKVISISASRYSLVVVMTTSLSSEELRKKGFPFPIPEGEEEDLDVRE